MGDASGDAAQVPPQVARLCEKDQSTVVQDEVKAIVYAQDKLREASCS